MTLLAGWTVLLARLSGQQELVVGTPVANRTRQEIEGLIGFFVNTLALRVDLSGSPTVGELLVRIKALALECFAHQDVPFEQVVEALQPLRRLSHSPLFQVMLAWQNTPEEPLELPGLRLSPVATPRVTAQFDLSLSVRESGEEIVGGIEYASALFEASTIERFLGYWRNLLTAMANRKPRRWIDCRCCLLRSGSRFWWGGTRRVPSFRRTTAYTSCSRSRWSAPRMRSR